jgi:hypothetical protein
MAGHSRWAKVKPFKDGIDAKLAKEIIAPVNHFPLR